VPEINEAGHTVSLPSETYDEVTKVSKEIVVQPGLGNGERLSKKWRPGVNLSLERRRRENCVE